MRVVYVSYEEAKELIPLFRWYEEKAPMREARKDAKVILKELEDVRSQSYHPLRGKQFVLNETQHEFFHSVADGVLEE